MNLWDRVKASGAGEPGFYFSNDKDWGTNPCCEIGLRPYQFCNLTEVNVSDLESQQDLEERVKAATLSGPCRQVTQTFTTLETFGEEQRKETHSLVCP